MPTLISFSGLPGVGKTTLARALARDIGATYLRVDSIEAALAASTSKIDPALDAGYLALVAVARDNLGNGLDVVADTVNPLHVTRSMFAQAAADSGAGLLDVEITCHNQIEHRRRVESRRAETGTGPTWEIVQSRDYEAWTQERLVLDAGNASVTEMLGSIKAALAG